MIRSILLLCVLMIFQLSFAEIVNQLPVVVSDSLSLQPDSLLLDKYELASVKTDARFNEKYSGLDYYIYLPKGFRRSKTYNLVIGMHGYLDSASHFGLLWKDLKNKNIIFVVPESPFSVLKGTEAVFKWGPVLNYKDVYSDAVYQKGEAAVIELLQHTRDIFHIRRTWLLGFSQGAGFTYLIAFHHPQLFDGIAPLSGWFVQTGFTDSEYASCKKIKVVIAHGSLDPIVSYGLSRKASVLLKNAGLKVKFISFRGGHVVNHRAIKYMVNWIRRK